MTLKRLVVFIIILLSTMGLLACGSNSIDETRKVKIQGIDQWIHIKANDLEKPVLLVLHGGPGFSMMPLIGQVNPDLADEFILVNWDQRGAGKSYNPDIPAETMTLNQFVLDANELTHYLKDEFNKEKIYLLGHSFGSLLGMKLLETYPENYCGYFGTGQMVDFIHNEQLSYDFALEMAIENEDTEILDLLETVGRPDDEGDYLLDTGYEVTSDLVEYYGGDLYGQNTIAPIYTLIFESAIYENDEENILEGYEFSQLIFEDETVRCVNLIKDIAKVDVPVYFLMGKNDYDTPSKLVEEYFQVLEAPQKELIWFDQSAHFPFFEEADKFSDTVIRLVDEVETNKE
jgi:pimeloyl-ACP methyl ester carboxylesterase